MIRRPPRSTRTNTILPYTTLCRSAWMVKSVFVIPMLDGSFVQFYFWVFLSGVLVCHVSATSPTPRGRLQKSLLSGVAGFAVCAIFLSSDAKIGRAHV